MKQPADSILKWWLHACLHDDDCSCGNGWFTLVLYLKITLDEYAFMSAKLMKRLINDPCGREFVSWIDVQAAACDRRNNEHKHQVSFLFNTLDIIRDSTFPSCTHVTEIFGLNKISPAWSVEATQLIVTERSAEIENVSWESGNSHGHCCRGRWW